MKNYEAFKLRIFLFIFLSLMAILKAYLVLVFPREIIYFSSGMSKFNYYNTLSFSLDMQSFRDANHPGTPIYMVGYLILLLVGNQIKDFYQYFYIHHFLILIFSIYSTLVFVNYFKKKIEVKKIFIFLIIFVSAFNFLFSLEVVGLIPYQFGISLLLITYFIKSINSKKNLKLALFCALSISIKMTFLPFVISILIAKIFHEMIENKSFQRILKFFSLFSIFFLLCNFPIIGRLPKVFLDIFFLRNDTFISLSKFFESFKVAFLELSSNSILTLPIIVIFLTIFLYNNFKFLIGKKKIIHKSQEFLPLIIFNILITFFYLFTFLNAAQVFSADLIINSLERENFFRNNYPYIVFIFINLYLSCKYFKIRFFKYENAIIIFSILLFLTTSFNYIKYRTVFIADKEERRKILIQKVSEHVNIEKEIIAYYNYSLAYSFGEELFHISGDSLEGNEKFTKEIQSIYKNFRFFRFNDVYNNLMVNTISHNAVNNFKNKIKKFDRVLKNNLPNSLYEILSYQTKNTSINPLIKRSNDIYSLQSNINYGKANALLFSHPNINTEQLIDEKDLYDYLKTRVIIKKRVVFMVKNDKWFLYLLK